MSEVTELTRELTATASHADETAAGDRIEDWLRHHTRASVERDEHGNVIARRGEGQESLAFVGHHDVVPPDESQVDPDGTYLVEERDGRLYGRGSADMKGSLAAAMLAFREAALGTEGELIFVSYVGEESGGVGVRGAIEDGFVPDYAVVGEGSTNYSGSDVTDVAVTHKGRRGSTLYIDGQAAHASEPEAGENAIYRASDAIGRIRELEAPETAVLGNRVTGSIVVTEIEGGSAWNVVPEGCTVTLDERTVPGERALLEPVEELPGVAWGIDQDLPPMACEEPAFGRLVGEAADAAQSGSPAQVVKPHATDAGWLAEAGTTCVVCGASEPGEAHTANESVSLSVLKRCERLYREVAERFSNTEL